MTHTYQITGSEDLNRSVVVVLSDRSVLVASDTHPNYRKIIRLLTDDVNEDGNTVYEDDVESRLRDLFDATIAVGEKLEKVSERVAVHGGHVYFDGSAVNDVLTEQIVRFQKTGQDFQHLVNFWEKIATNPNEHSREHLYRWLVAQGQFTITPDGNLIAYKGLDKDGFSIHSGPGNIVDGVRVDGKVPNKIGSTIEMDRSRVMHDPSQGCSVGLHAGTWSFASAFGSGLCAEVSINPRDVVSVPTDSGDQKMRVCRYTVLKYVGEARPEPVYGEDWDDDDGYWDDEDWSDDEVFEGLDDDLQSVDEVTVPAGSLRSVLSSLRSAIRGRQV